MEGSAGDAEDLGGLRLVAARRLERGEDLLLLGVGEGGCGRTERRGRSAFGCPQNRVFRRICIPSGKGGGGRTERNGFRIPSWKGGFNWGCGVLAAPPDFRGQVRFRQLLAGCEDDHPLDDVAEFTDVSGPGVAFERGQRVLLEAPDAARVLLRELLQEARGEKRDVAGPFAKRRQVDRNDVQPEEEVLAELPFGDHLLEVLVRRGDEPEVDGGLLAGAEAADGFRLKRPEKGDLGRHVDLADLVEAERAAGGGFDAAFLACLESAGEGAGDIAEELRLEEVAGERRAFDGDEGLVLAGREIVEGLRDELLAGAAFALDQHGRGGGGDAADELVDSFHRRRGAGEGVESALCVQLRFEVRHLAFQGADLEDAFDAGAELGEVGDGLGEEVVRTVLHRLDRELDFAEGGDEDRADRRELRLRRPDELDAVHHGHLVVREDQRDIRRAVKLGEGEFGIGCRETVVFSAEDPRHRVAGHLLVVYDQYLGLGHVKMKKCGGNDVTSGL